MDVVAWLRELGLERYEPAFRANEIDWAVLPKLTSEDLREIGVVPIGHRRRMLDAIAVLSNERTIAVATARRQQVDAERRVSVRSRDLRGGYGRDAPKAAVRRPRDFTRRRPKGDVARMRENRVRVRADVVTA